MSTALNWRTVTTSSSPKFLVKGTELSVAIVPGTLSRFQICEVRAYDKDGYADRHYYIRDAHRLTDDQIKQGVRPPVVGCFVSLDDAIKWCS